LEDDVITVHSYFSVSTNDENKTYAIV